MRAVCCAVCVVYALCVCALCCLGVLYVSAVPREPCVYMCMHVTVTSLPSQRTKRGDLGNLDFSNGKESKLDPMKNTIVALVCSLLIQQLRQTHDEQRRVFFAFNP